MQEKGTLEGYPHAVETNTTNPLSFMEKECDLFVPAATEKSIHKFNASKL
jgi:glutamate dehydrogenase/leucine dehydrogenase